MYVHGYYLLDSGIVQTVWWIWQTVTCGMVLK